MKNKTRFVVFAGLSAALSYVVAKFTAFSIFPATPYLRMHFGEVPLLLITLCGSLKLGICSLFVKEILSFFISGSNIFGLISDFILVTPFLITTKLVAKKLEGKKGQILIESLCGAVVRMILCVPVNIVILKFQYGTPVAGVMAQMLYILPFNFLKSMLDGICISLIYQKLNNPLKIFLQG